MYKADMRKQMMLQRKRLTDDDVCRLSKAATLRLELAIDWQSVRRIHIYQSRHDWNELDTRFTRSFIQARWPHISIFVGVASKHAAMPSGTFDLIVVPLLAFDNELHRAGFGGGWYDRFLAQQPQALKIGLAYDFQHVTKVPHEAHDIPLDMVITETEAITKSASHR